MPQGFAADSPEPCYGNRQLNGYAQATFTARARLAARVVRANPLDENYQVLLVRSLAAFRRRDCGRAAGRAVHTTFPPRRSASNRVRRSPRPPRRSPRPRPQVRSAGGQPRRRSSKPARRRLQLAPSKPACSVSAARSATLAPLATRSFRPRRWSLSGRLSYTRRADATRRPRPRCTSAAAALRFDLASLAAAASRELGYVEFLQGRYERAQGWLARPRRRRATTRLSAVASGRCSAPSSVTPPTTRPPSGSSRGTALERTRG